MQIPSGVRAIFFDAVGTLIHPEPSASAVYAAFGRRHGSRLDESTIAVRFHAAFRREEEMDRAAGWRTSEAREVERWRRIVTTVLRDAGDREACFRELFTYFSRPEAWQATPDAADVLGKLSRRGYRLGIASNYDHRLRSVLAGHPDLAIANHLAISSEIGWRKPAPEFFTTLCHQFELSPEQILLVGDDVTNDYEGARAAGLQAVLIAADDSPLRRKEDCIRQLGELL